MHPTLKTIIQTGTPQQAKSRKSLWRSWKSSMLKLHQSNILTENERFKDLRISICITAHMLFNIKPVNNNSKNESLICLLISTSAYHTGCDWHSGNIWKNTRTKASIWSMTIPVKADPLCFRYETHHMSAGKAAEKYFFRLLKACRDYVICLSVSADLPVVSESRPGRRTSR